MLQEKKPKPMDTYTTVGHDYRHTHTTVDYDYGHIHQSRSWLKPLSSSGTYALLRGACQKVKDGEQNEKIMVAL